MKSELVREIGNLIDHLDPKITLWSCGQMKNKEFLFWVVTHVEALTELRGKQKYEE